MASEDDDQLQLAMALSRESAGRRRGRFTKRLRVFGAGTLGGTVFEGNQIRLPAVVMSELFEDDPQGEHVYQVRTVQERMTYVGVKDYASPDPQRCVVPLTVMQALGIENGSGVELTLVNATSKLEALRPLPVATELKLRWEDCEQYNTVWALEDAELADVQTTLENSLNSNFPVIKLNDLVRFHYKDDVLDMRVVGLRKRAGELDPSEEEQMQRAMAASLGQKDSSSQGQAEITDHEEVLRLRVPAWEAFDRKLIVEPPSDWIPPRPFSDAVWDAARRMYYPAGWEWDEAQQTYAKPEVADLPALQRARSESTRPEAPQDYGAGQTLGGEQEEKRPLTQEELRQKRLRAMEERLSRAESSPQEKVARHEQPSPLMADTAPEKHTCEEVQERRGLRMSMRDLEVRTFHVGGKQGWQAMRDITVEVDSATFSDYFRKCLLGGWPCKWLQLFGSIHSDAAASGESGLPRSTVCVQAIWEPPQHASDAAFSSNEQGIGTPPRLLRAPAATEAVRAAAAAAGLVEVGWLFTCPPRSPGFSLRAEEALHAAYLQLDKADGYSEGEPPFVTLRMSFKTADLGPELELTAWCATQQAMEMRAKGFFDVCVGASRYRDAARVAEGFRVIQEGRESGDVDVTFLHRPVPIRQRSDVGLALDLQSVADAITCPLESEEMSYEQITRWAPPELRSQVAFLGEGQRLGGSKDQQVSDEAMPSEMHPVLRKALSEAGSPTDGHDVEVVDEARASEIRRMVTESLDRMAAAGVQKQQDCCSTLLKLLSNVMTQPDEAKFRRLKKSNKALQSKVFTVPGAEQLLTAVGWHLDLEDEAYVLPAEAAIGIIDLASSLLREHLELLAVASAADAGGAEVSAEWRCSTCTLINPGTISECDACGTPKY